MNENIEFDIYLFYNKIKFCAVLQLIAYVPELNLQVYKSTFP
jgi:hypothetical protein